MKKKITFKKPVRTFTVILVLLGIHFGIMLAEKHFTQTRKMASQDGATEKYSVSADKDLSESSPEEFKKAFKYQLLKDAVIVSTQGNPGVRLGNFLMKDSRRVTVPVCDLYPTIDFIFAAEGIAFSGEIPHMIVRGPCLTSPDQNHLEALPVPWGKILNSPVQQFEFTSALPYEQGKISIYFRNVIEFWPTEWVLIGVKLYGKTSDDNLQVNGYEVISILGQPLYLKAGETIE
ncbi:MAG: hypothetical protein HUU57_12685 [Bdellovibrio sp.]|nr:hypothetical protein [Bdellovibrio sp.]